MKSTSLAFFRALSKSSHLNKRHGETWTPLKESTADVRVTMSAWEQLSEFRSGSFLALTSTHWGRWAPQRLWRREGAAGRRRGGGCGCGGKRGFTLVFTLGVGPPNPSPQPRGTYLRPSETPWRCTLTTWLTITQSYPHKNTYTHTLHTWWGFVYIWDVIRP